MFKLKVAVICIILVLLPGCAMVPVGIGFIPGAPSYFSSLIGGGQTVYQTAMDERSTRQQMLDSIIAGHAQAELLKNKDIGADQISTYCYFGRLYLVGEYDSQEQLRSIHESMEEVEGKRALICRLYLKNEGEDHDILTEQVKYAELRTQLLADFQVSSSPIEVEIVQGDIILLGTIADREERDRIMAHALSMDNINRVIAYLEHPENGGPEPRIMTATLPEKSKTALAETPVKKHKRHTRPTVAAKKEPAKPVLMVSNPDRGR